MKEFIKDLLEFLWRYRCSIFALIAIELGVGS